MAHWDRSEVSTQSELEAAVAKMCSLIPLVDVLEEVEGAVFMNRGDPAETEREHFRE